ncbi:hypothetical protein ACTXT7_015809 [Hymenolepis weldensis]
MQTHADHTLLQRCHLIAFVPYLSLNHLSPHSVQVANDDIELHPLFRDGVKVTNVTHSKEFFMSKVVPARLE